MPSSTKPIAEQVARATALLNDPQHYRYFFERLENPEWVQPLRSHGFFSRPPAPLNDEEGYTLLPPWPESAYLARMAARGAETAQIVLDVALSIPETENTRVHEDLVAAALAMPPALAAQVVPMAKKWLQSRFRSQLPLQLGQLMAYLAREGQTAAALDLAKALLAVSRDPRAAEPATTDDEYRPSPTPQAHCDLWTYEQILKNYLPVLTTAAGDATLTMLCSCLNAAIRFSQRDPKNRGPEDYSHIWRRHIEEDREHGAHDVTEALVAAVRDTAEKLAKDNPAKVPALVAILEGYRWWVFHRIALHLLRLFPDHAHELIATRLTDRSQFEERTPWREYTLLAREQFLNLTPEQRQSILAWVATGPDPEEVAAVWAWRKDQLPPVPEAEYCERYRKTWQLKHLARLAEVLPPEWRESYDDLVRELGEREQPEFDTSYSGVRSGPTSPMSVDELRDMDPAELVTYLQSWTPSSPFPFDPSPEGLSSDLTSLVAANPSPYIAHAERFKALDAIYVQGLLAGLRDATRSNVAFDWSPALDLCRWVGETLAPQEGDADSRRPAIRWACGAAADLLESGLTMNPTTGIPFTLRAQAWAALQPLTNNADPSGEAAGGDLANRSINTVRGKAMHAVVRYALWVRDHLKAAGQGEGSGFAIMPEARETLEAHLDPGYDPSPVIRSVYGQWFPWLVQLDSDWASQNIKAIFPQVATLQQLRDAAWTTYLQFCQPYDDTFAVLHEEYRRATERLEPGASENPVGRNLAEHLMAFYGRGKLVLEGSESILGRFHANASPSAREEAMEFVGRTLRHASNVPSPILARFRALWETRLAAAQEAEDVAPYAGELAAFGWWFASRKLEPAWSMAQLQAALQLVPRTEPDHLVLDRLAVLAPIMPLDAVICLRLMVEGDVRRWLLVGHDVQVRAILSAALESQGEAKQLAAALVQDLGRLGHLGYGTLLGPRTQ